MTCLGEMRSQSNSTTGIWMPGMMVLICTPHINCTTDRTISIMPKDAITRMIVGLARKGL